MTDSIGPGDSLYFYQQTFSGPGLSFALDVFSVTSKKKTAADDAKVYIVIEAKPIEFIKDLRVRVPHQGSHPSTH
jgi:hypothetical protein